MPSVAFSQDEDATDNEKYIEEITVTARKKAESLMEVPMNITAVGSTEILERNLITKEEIYRTVAGGSAPGGELILRGLAGSNDSAPGTTSTWTDDIPFNFSDLYDVQRVEVLRGPQGTLYGSNAIGGTVRVISNQPDLTEMKIFGAAVFKTEENRPGSETRAYAGINVPFGDGKWATRIVGASGSREGKIMNTNTGTSGKESDHFVRAQLLWSPSDDLDMNLSFINEKSFVSGYDWADRSQPGYYYEAILTENPDATYGYDVYLTFPECTGERPQCRGGAPVSPDYDPKFAVWETLDPWEETEHNVVSLRVQKDDLFQGVDLIYAGSLQKYDFASLDNWSRNDANDMFRTWIINDDGYDRVTSELRLQSNAGKAFEWTLGAFYDETDWKSTVNGQWQYHASDNRSRAIAEYLWGYYYGLGDPTQIGLDLYGDPTKNYNYSQFKYNQKEFALFGELTYTFDMGDAGNLEVTAGDRYYDLNDNIHTQVSGIWIGPEAQDTITQDGESGDRKKISVSYMPNDAFTVFGVYSEGYRPGGNNGPNAPQDCSADENIGAYVDRYKSDQIDNMELGLKGLAFDRRFQYSAAVYQIDWTGVQASVYMPSCGFSYVANAAKAESRGVEFESTAMLTNSLSLQVNAGYTNSEMTEDVPSLGASAGDDMTMVPKYNYYVALNQDFVWLDRGASVRLDVAGYGEYKSHFNVKDEDISPAYEVVGLSGSLEVTENARVGLYVNNLLNEEIITYKRSRYRDNWPLGNQYYYYGEERSISLRVDFNF
jgi:outer membrane receptor protein involved in Fe transport